MLWLLSADCRRHNFDRGNAVESHGRGASANHRDDNPENLSGAGNPFAASAAPRKQRVKEQSMLDLDHLERKSHVSITVDTGEGFREPNY